MFVENIASSHLKQCFFFLPSQNGKSQQWVLARVGRWLSILAIAALIALSIPNLPQKIQFVKPQIINF
ncbi:MAG: hypothetical protein ACRC62_23630 [Microcoleus sp.]